MELKLERMLKEVKTGHPECEICGGTVGLGADVTGKSPCPWCGTDPEKAYAKWRKEHNKD